MTVKPTSALVLTISAVLAISGCELPSDAGEDDLSDDAERAWTVMDQTFPAEFSYLASDGYPLENMTGLAGSADGLRLAASQLNGYIYTSADGGANWTRQSDAGLRMWNGMAGSADGETLFAVVGGSSGFRAVGFTYRSEDGGSSWAEDSSLGGNDWQDISCSSDGAIVAAVADYVYVSSDGGDT